MTSPRVRTNPKPTLLENAALQLRSLCTRENTACSTVSMYTYKLVFCTQQPIGVFSKESRSICSVTELCQRVGDDDKITPNVFVVSSVLYFFLRGGVGRPAASLSAASFAIFLPRWYPCFFSAGFNI